MRICMVLAGQDFPPDIRVEKEARCLKRAGHVVTILCEQRSSKNVEDEWEGCRVVRLPRQRTKGARLVNNLIKGATLNDWWWKRFLTRVVAEDGKFDILHVHDLPMLGTVIEVAKRNDIKIVADLHENYPAAIKYYQEEMKWPKRLVMTMLVGAGRWQRFENRCLKAAQRVVVVVDEAKERLTRNGINPQKVTVIENTEDVEYFQRFQVDQTIPDTYRNKFVLLYLGGFGGRHRGLDTLVRAMPKIVKAIPDALLLLVGNGPIKPQLQRLAERIKVTEAIKYVDWVPFAQAPSYIASSAVCLVPHHSNPHTEATSPHKLYQYMLMGKPVLVSSCKPLRRVVEATGCGLVFEAGNPSSLADAVIFMKNREVREHMGGFGKAAVLERFNWDITGKTLIEAYREIELLDENKK